MELKDQFNHGFVFRGPDLVIQFGFERQNINRIFDYSFSLGGGGKTTLDSWGFRWAINPINLSYAVNVTPASKAALFLGPALYMNYSIQNYPEMHTGHLNWMTNYSLALQILGVIPVKKKNLNIQLTTALISLVSRPETNRDPYFFSTKAADIIRNINSNLKLASSADFLRTNLSIGFNLGAKRFLAYELQYISHSGQPQFHQLSHALRYVFYFRDHGGQAK